MYTMLIRLADLDFSRDDEWHAVDHDTGAVLGYTFGTREDQVFLELKRLLQPFGIRRFYTDVLGCKKLSTDGITAGIPENIDLFVFSDGQVFGIEYTENDAQCLSLDQHRQACWLELKTDDSEALKSRCLDNGAIEITDYWDREHFYFHAPGGQIFRIIGDEEV